MLLILKMQPEIGGSYDTVCEGHTLDLQRVKHKHSKRSELGMPLDAQTCNFSAININFMLI